MESPARDFLLSLMYENELTSGTFDEKAYNLCCLALRLARKYKNGQLSDTEATKTFLEFKKECNCVINGVRELLITYKAITETERLKYYDEYRYVINELLDWLDDVFKTGNIEQRKWSKIQCKHEGLLNKEIIFINFDTNRMNAEVTVLRARIDSLNQQREKSKGEPKDSKSEIKENANILTGEPLALAMLVEHPDWSDTKIAKKIGINRTTLYDWSNFKKAKEALKEGKNHLPKGRKDSKNGNIEAWD